MRTFSTLVSISLIASTTLFGATNEQVIKFVKNGISNNPMVTINSIKVTDHEKMLNPKGWEYFIVDFDLTLKRDKQEQHISQKDIVFASGNFVAPDLININTNKSMKNVISPSIPDSFYDKAHLIAGDMNAKHKMVVFSDPVCPFCKKVMPDIIDDVNANPKDLALFYFHMPLEMIHPSAPTITKAMIVAHEKGEDVVKKVYQTDLDYSKTNPKDILDEFNKKIGTNITLKDIEGAKVVSHLLGDKKAAKDMLVKGTPTVFFDSKLDNTREKYKDIIKKAK
jgi:protein-disulfide isomerase